MPRTTTRAKARAIRKPNAVHRKIALRKAARKRDIRYVPFVVNEYTDAK